MSLVGQNFLQKLIFFMLRVVHIVQEAIKDQCSSHSLCKFSCCSFGRNLGAPAPCLFFSRPHASPSYHSSQKTGIVPLTQLSLPPFTLSSSKFLELVYGPHPSLDIHHPTQTLALSELKFLPFFEAQRQWEPTICSNYPTVPWLSEVF